jgi:large subunit ribosomal protein L29
MKVKEIRDMTTAELEHRLEEVHQELFNLRFQRATKQLANYQRIGQVKKTIAQMKTILQERELLAQQELLAQRDEAPSRLTSRNGGRDGTSEE